MASSSRFAGSVAVVTGGASGILVEDAFYERIPMRRWGTPEDMAAAAPFLAQLMPAK